MAASQAAQGMFWPADRSGLRWSQARGCHCVEPTEKRAARGCKRPKSREETPKEGGGNAKRSRYRAAAICHRAAQKASPDSARPSKEALRGERDTVPPGGPRAVPLWLPIALGFFSAR